MKKMMHLGASLLLVMSTQVIAEETDAAANLTKSLENIQTFKAHFEQKIRGVDGENVSKSAGEMMVRRPGKFYWKSQSPDAVLVVADGKHLWTYDIDLSQVTKQELNQALGNTPASLLAGSVVNLKDSFKIATAKKNQCRGSDECYVLNPLSKETAVADIIIGFAKGKLHEIRMHDSLGQDVYTQFTKVQLNPDLESKIFDFKPPKGVDVIQAGT